jgi:alpha-N-arabinofuranosidase
MRQTVRAAGLLAWLLLLAGGAWAQGFPANGDFAQGGTPPSGWVMEPEAARKGSLSFAPAPPGAAGQTLVLAPNAANTPSDKPFGVGQMLPGAAVKARSYVVRAHLGGEGGARAVLGLAALGPGGVIAQVQLRGDGAMAMQEERLTLPASARVQGVVLFLVAEGTAGAARFAAVSVRDASAAAPATPAPAAPPAAAPPPAASAPPPGRIAATVRIDTTRVLRTIPRGIFGTNIEINEDGQGLWDKRMQRLDPQIVALARELALGPIRFPGGVWSDGYNWRDGVGPVARRPRTRVAKDANWTVHHVLGTDEALDLARQVNSTLMITVNAGTGTPELAADWVRYVNGEGGRSPRGPRVELWEIGNELYMEGDASGGHMSPQAYAERVIAFSRAMKAVDPGIKVAAIGLRNFGRYRLNAYDNWNEVVLKRTGGVIDLLAIHNAYAPALGDDARVPATDVYRALLAFPQAVARNLADTRREIERFAPTDAARIRIAVTEWGPLFAVNPQSPWIHHVRTLGSAVYVASILKALAEEPAVAEANFFKLNEASFMGWIARRGGQWVETAPYKAFRLVSRGMQPGLLAAKVDVARFNGPRVGMVEAESGVPYLDVLASAAPDGRTVTALLINKSLDAALQTRVEFGARGARLVSETLTGAAPDANTGTELPRVPGLNWAKQRPVGPQGRIDMGGPDEIRLLRDERADPPEAVDVSVPPHSIMLLRLEGVRRP